MGSTEDFLGFMNGIGNGLLQVSEQPWHSFDNVVDKGSEVIDHGVDTVSDIFKNLQMPLILGGGIILLIMMNK